MKFSDIINYPEYLYKLHLKRMPRHVVRFPNFEKVKDILIVFESDSSERNLQIKQLVTELRQAGKYAAAIGYVDKNQAESGRIIDFDILCKQDVNWFQKPKKNKLENLQEKHYDLLIDICLNDCIPLQYITLYANADFKAGKQRNAPYLTDLMIKLPEDNAEIDSAYLFDQIMFYLKQIKSND